MEEGKEEGETTCALRCVPSWFSLSPAVFPLLPPFPRYAASVEPVRALSPRFHLHSTATSFFLLLLLLFLL